MLNPKFFERDFLKKPIRREEFLRFVSVGVLALAFGCGRRQENSEIKTDFGKKIKKILESFYIQTEIDFDHWADKIDESIQEEWRESVFVAGENEIQKEELNKKRAVVLAIIERESNFDIKEESSFARTLGPMQVNKERIKEEENLNEEEVKNSLTTVEGGIKYGVKYLAKISEIYKYVEDEELKLKCIFADYNAGVFASRNASIQVFLNKFSNKSLEIDGLIGEKTKKILKDFLLENNISEEQFEEDFKKGALSSLDLINTKSWKKMEEINGGVLSPCPPETPIPQNLIKRLLRMKLEKNSEEYAQNRFDIYKKVLQILD